MTRSVPLAPAPAAATDLRARGAPWIRAFGAEGSFTRFGPGEGLGSEDRRAG